MSKSSLFAGIAGLLCVSVISLPAPAATNPAAAMARQILDATGVKGGLVVQVGCAADATAGLKPGQLAAALHADDSYLVHALYTDAADVAGARKHIRDMAGGGRISAAQFDGKHLPYIDNSVNLLVSMDLGDVSPAEVIRVLCPGGVALVRSPKSADKFTKTVKPRPSNIDEWTHYMHDATGNAVAHDDVIAPPQRLQWQAGPKWGRHHDRMSSISACVAAGGRVFYIVDEATRASILTPGDWKLVARDAFNGTVLWKRPIAHWYPNLMPLKSGPAVLPRRLVAVGDRVYVTLGIDAPLTALDAATGKDVRSYENTDKTQEILDADGVLYVVSDIPGQAAPGDPGYDAATMKRRGIPTKEVIWDLKTRRIQAIEAQTGKQLWQVDMPVMPMTLAVGPKGVYLCDGERVVSLGRADGKVRWRSEKVPRASKLYSFFGATLVVYDGVVLFAGGEKAGLQTGAWVTEPDTMTALDAETGKELWHAPHPACGYRSPEDVLVLNGVVWAGNVTSGRGDGEFTGRDVKTGKVVGDFKPNVTNYWFHHRCYRGKATDKYLLMSRTGTEFIDPKTGHWTINDWTRGACLYGLMPANGMLYNPPHPCACYLETKEFGFTALAPAPPAGEADPPADNALRLTKGPAYEFASAAEPVSDPGGWSTYRCDNERSGRTTTPVPTKVKEAWSTWLGGKLSAVVVSGGKLFVAMIDDHTVHALDAASGKDLWKFTAGGRVDSPPTVYRGLAIFGCADGWVYCLRASDGELAWRFRAAPADRRLVAFDQVESVWPVHGSVLVRDGVVHCVAGRSMFLDGGLHMIQLDARTGRLIREKVLGRDVPETGKDLQSYVDVLSLPVALPDVLSCDANHVYMRSQRFDLEDNRQDIAPRKADQQLGVGVHLFSPTGFLDGDYWHRSYWVFGRTFTSGWDAYYQAGKNTPSGKILTFDGDTVYGFGRKAKYYRWTTPIECELFAETRGMPRPTAGQGRQGKRSGDGPWITVDKSASLDPTGKALAVEAWVKADKPNGVVVALGGPSQGYALTVAGGKPEFSARRGKTLAVATAQTNVVGKWVHLAGVLTADGKVKVFVDGKLAASSGGAKLLDSQPVQGMQIGADAGGAVGKYESPSALTGLIDEVRVFHGSVTDAEIADHAAGADHRVAKDAKCVLHLTFDGNARDMSGCKNPGRLGPGAVMVAGRFGKALKVAPAKPALDRRGKPKPASDNGQRRWAENLPILVRAMVLADKTLFVAGLPDLVDEDEAYRDMNDSKTQAALAEQTAAWAGKRGASLLAISAGDGARLAQVKLESPPVWDGLSAAYGKLYLATMDGKIICLAP